MALQNTEKRHFRSEQNGHCDQQVTDVPRNFARNFAHVFANKVPALSARKSRVPPNREIRSTGPVFLAASPKRAIPEEDGHMVAKGRQSLGIGGAPRDARNIREPSTPPLKSDH